MDKVTEDAIAVLESAAFVQMIPGVHCKGAMARHIVGFEVALDSGSACRFCAIGALRVASLGNDPAYDKALVALTDTIPGVTVVGYNDQQTITGKDVAFKMLKAADGLRKGAE